MDEAVSSMFKPTSNTDSLVPPVPADAGQCRPVPAVPAGAGCRPAVPAVPAVPAGAGRCRPVPAGAGQCRPVPAAPAGVGDAGGAILYPPLRAVTASSMNTTPYRPTH